MTQFQIRTFSASDIKPVVTLQQSYTQLYPEAPVIPGEVYLSPGFHGGQDVICAFSSSGELSGYAPVYAKLASGGPEQPHILWTEIKTDPDLSSASALKECLFQYVLNRARELIQEDPGHKTQLTFQYYPSEIPSIQFVLSKGCTYTESIFRMCRERTEGSLPSIPGTPLPAGVAIRSWRMETEAEQQAYVQAHNEALPEAAFSLADWQYFLGSPQWSIGTTLTAFGGERIVGSVALYWDEAENQARGQKLGYTENVFVQSAWRGHGIARHLLVQGLVYLYEHGLETACLEVRAQNQAALNIYQQLGYRVVQESRLYVLEL
jgi:ribosomal protein S18 acetylase RimI-like enzyme